MRIRTTTAAPVPAARTIDLITTESKDEVLVYDETVHHIHHLNATAATVWRLCDGTRTVSEIAMEAGITEDAVKLALRTLEDAKLLDGPLPAEMRGTQSRRAFMKKVGVASIPAIVSVTAPMAAAAHSHCNNVKCQTHAGCGDGCGQCSTGKGGQPATDDPWGYCYNPGQGG